jgi:hypothetical protein
MGRGGEKNDEGDNETMVSCGRWKDMSCTYMNNGRHETDWQEKKSYTSVD